MRRSFFAILANQLRRGYFLWPFKQAVKKPLIRLASAAGEIFPPGLVPGPIHAVFFTTYACNLRCHFCDLPYRHIEYSQQEGKKELALPEKLRVLDDLKAIGASGVGFTGGEPMLRSDTLDLIRYAYGLGIVTHLSSNGFPFQTIETTKKIMDSGLDAVTLSLDGASAEMHDRIRGKQGSHHEVITAIRNILAVRRDEKKNFSLTTTTVITKDNYKEIPALIELLSSEGVDQIGFMPVQDIGLDYEVNARSKDFSLSDLDSEKIHSAEDAVEYILEYKRKTGKIENTVEYLQLFKDAFQNKPLPIQCYAGYTTIAVDSWGDIFPCFAWAEMRKSVANIRDISLKNFWLSKGCADMRTAARACRDCYWNNQTELNLLISKKRVPPPSAQKKLGQDYKGFLSPDFFRKKELQKTK